MYRQIAAGTEASISMTRAGDRDGIPQADQSTTPTVGGRGVASSDRWTAVWPGGRWLRARRLAWTEFRLDGCRRLKSEPLSKSRVLTALMMSRLNKSGPAAPL